MEQSKSLAWDNILTHELVTYINNLVSDKEEEGIDIIGEDEHRLKEFFLQLRNHVNYKATVMLAIMWQGLDDTQQANLAISHVGWKNASLYIMLQDYLSNDIINNSEKYRVK